MLPKEVTLLPLLPKMLFEGGKMDKLELKLEYNRLIKRLNKADIFFNDDNISLDRRSSEKIIQAYSDLIKELSTLQTEYKRLYGSDMKEVNKYNGF